MPPLVPAQGFKLDFDDVYARIWELAVDDRGDGTRLDRPAAHQALKWLIADLAGTPAERGKTLPANNATREQVHRLLEDTARASDSAKQASGCSDVLSSVRRASSHRPNCSRRKDPDDHGQVIDDVPVEAVTEDHQVTLG